MRKLNCEWIELPVGIALIALVIYVIVAPGEVFDSVIITCGLVAVIAGFIGIVRHTYFERRTGLSLLFSILAGILCILTGSLIFLDFALGVLAFTTLSPVWFAVYCLSYLCDTRTSRWPATGVRRHKTPRA